MHTRLRVFAATTAMLLTTVACSSGSESGSNKDDALELTNSTPAAKGKIANVVWGLPFGEPTSLDPVKAADASSTSVIANLCDTLLTRDADLAVQPGLATKWEWVTPTTLQFSLRDDATFWDGTPVTAKDIAFSLKRAADPASGSVNGPYFERMKSVDATGPNEVSVTFSAPDSLFVDAMAGFPGAIVQQAAVTKSGDDFGSATTGLMCSGPYKLDRWASGESIKISSTGTWWGGQPKVGSLEFRFVTDNSTLTAALSSGEIDGAMNLTSSAVPALKRASGGKLYAAAGTVTLAIIPSSDTGPATDPKIRQAIDLSIDKQAFVDNVMNGAGELVSAATTPAFWSGNPAAEVYDKAYADLPKPSFDIAGAKKLVEESGASGEPITMAVLSGDQLGQQIGSVVQEAGKKIGLSVKIRAVQPNEFFGMFYDKNARQGIDFLITQDAAAIPAPNAYMPTYVLPKGIFNYTGFDDADVTKDLEESRSTTDATKSADAFTRAQAIFEKDRVKINVSSLYQLTFLNSKLTGTPVSLATIASPWAAALGAP